MKILITSLLLLSSLSFAGTTYDLNCENNDIYTDLGIAEVALNAKLTVNAANDYVIDEGGFRFFIEDNWTDQNVAIDRTSNYASYNPRVYTKHAKFPRIAKAFFGKVDFIVPHKALLKGEKTFTGTFILSWVEDHWGGTVTADCSLISL